jgi:F0F1-type ATP synthase membrane subunit b/b'
LLEDFELIHVAESLAEEILDEAKLRVEAIRKETVNEQGQAYGAAYDAEITAAKRNAEENVEQARTDAEKEANLFLRRAEEQVTAVKETARMNFETAVNAVIAEIIE